MSNAEALQEGNAANSTFFEKIVRIESLESPFTAVRRYHGAVRRFEQAQEELVVLRREDSFTNGEKIARKSSEVNELSRQVENGPGIRREMVLFDRFSVPFIEARRSREIRLQRQASRIAQEEVEQASIDFAAE